MANKAKFELSVFYKDLVELLTSLHPTEYDYEKNFQNDLANLLADKYEEKVEVKTIPLERNRNFSSIDIVVKINELYIPLELKFRKEESSIADYDKDYVDDILRIRTLMRNFDDIPMGFAICLTDNVVLKMACDLLVYVYNSKHYLYGERKMGIDWKVLQEGEFACGIAGWYWAGPKYPLSKKSFAEFWNRKDFNNRVRI